MTKSRLEFILECIQGIYNDEYYSSISTEEEMNSVLKNWGSFQLVGIYPVSGLKYQNSFLNTVSKKKVNLCF